MDLKQLHYDVMDGKTDYIPLMINIAVKEPMHVGAWEATYQPQQYIDAMVHNRSLDAAFPTDRVVTIESNFQETLIPCMFGAKPCQTQGGHIDVRATIDSIDQAEALQVKTDILNQAVEHLKYLKTHTPAPFHVAISRFMSPLDYAVVLRGGDFYMDLCLAPEKSIAFLHRITDVTLQAIKRLKAAASEDYTEHITANRRGIHIRGTRLSADAFVNLSPQMIEDIMIPLFRRFHDALGGLFLHYCTLPFPAGHVLPTLAKHDVVDGVDNWQGYASFFNKNMDGVLQDTVSMCFDVEIEQLEDIEETMRLPLFQDVRRNGGRGLFVATYTDDMERAKRLYDRWRRHFNA